MYVTKNALSLFFSVEVQWPYNVLLVSGARYVGSTVVPHTMLTVVSVVAAPGCDSTISCIPCAVISVSPAYLPWKFVP